VTYSDMSGRALPGPGEWLVWRSKWEVVGDYYQRTANLDETEIVSCEDVLRAVRRLPWGDDLAAVDFIGRYGPWTTRSLNFGATVLIDAWPWWCELVRLQRALWLMDTLTGDDLDVFDDCRPDSNWQWPDGLGFWDDYLDDSNLCFSDNNVVFAWKLLGQQINLGTPPLRVCMDFDSVSGRLVEVRRPLPLLDSLWRKIKEQSLSIRPTLRCQYSKCRKPIQNPARLDTLYCPGSAKCRKGGNREHGRQRKKLAPTLTGATATRETEARS
jgi:hypothetical protein